MPVLLVTKLGSTNRPERRRLRSPLVASLVLALLVVLLTVRPAINLQGAGAATKRAAVKTKANKPAKKSGQTLFRVVYSGKGTFNRRAKEETPYENCDKTVFSEAEDTTFDWSIFWYLTLFDDPTIGPTVVGVPAGSRFEGTASRSMSGEYIRGEECRGVDGTCSESAAPSISGSDFASFDSMLQVNEGKGGLAIRAFVNTEEQDFGYDERCTHTANSKGPFGWGDTGWPFYYSSLASDVTTFRRPFDTRLLVMTRADLLKFGKQIFPVNSDDPDINVPVPGPSYDCSGKFGQVVVTCLMGQKWAGSLSFQKLDKRPSDYP